MSDQVSVPRLRPGRASLTLVEAKDLSQIADLVIWRDDKNFPLVAAKRVPLRGTVPRNGTRQGGGEREKYKAVSALKSLPPIAANIRAARLDAGLTQEQLAAVVGVRRTRINDWENGRHEPSRKHITELCAALGRTRGWLVDPHPRNNPEDQP